MHATLYLSHVQLRIDVHLAAETFLKLAKSTLSLRIFFEPQITFYENEKQTFSCVSESSTFASNCATVIDRYHNQTTHA